MSQARSAAAAAAACGGGGGGGAPLKPIYPPSVDIIMKVGRLHTLVE